MTVSKQPETIASTDDQDVGATIQVDTRKPAASNEAIQRALTLGESSGDPQLFDPEEFKRRMRAASAKAVRRRQTTQG